MLVRDLIAGAELAKLEQSNREAYLKRQAEAQHEADEDKLVDAVPQRPRAPPRKLELVAKLGASPRYLLGDTSIGRH